MAKGQATFRVYAWTAILYITKKIKLSLCLVKHYAMKTYGRVGVQLHRF
jgi:hypothetical protein